MTEFERNLLKRLVQDKIITEDIAIVAEQLQLEKGGRIDTNLLDLRAVDEETIIKYLQMVSRLRAISIEKVEDISKDIIALFPARLAIRYRMIPFSVEHNTISLIISDPTDIALLEEVSFLLGMDVKPFIAPDLWIEHLLCKHYKVEPNKRYEELFSIIRNKKFEVKSVENIRRESDIEKDKRVVEQSASHMENAKDALARGKEVAGRSSIEVKIIDTDTTKPYTYSREQALEDIKSIKDRDAIMFYALKYAYQYFDFCAIFIFQRDRVRGFSFLGNDRGIDREFKTLDLSVNGDNIFKLVKETGAHFLGVVPIVGENEIFIKKLKRPYPPNVLVVPITVAGKVIGVFYADNGELLVRGEDVPHILTFFHVVSNQLQELIRFLKFNTPPYKVVLRYKGEEGERLVDGEGGKGIEVVRGSPMEGISNSEASNLSDVLKDVPKDVQSAAVEQEKTKSENIVSESTDQISEEVVKELSQYVESYQEAGSKKDSQKMSLENVTEKVEYEKIRENVEKSVVEKSVTKDKKEELFRKEEEYRINLLLDTIEQSPNAINSPAYDQLIAEKEKALPYIAKRFPGRLKIDLLMQSSSDISDVEEHSNLIQLIIGIGKEALPYIVPLMKSDNHTIRFYSVFIFSKLRFQEAIPHLLEAIFDSSPKISLVAIEVLNRYKNFPKFSMVLARLRSELVSNDNDKVKLAALSLGQFKDLESVPQLIKLLTSKSESVREAALNSLRDICKEDFGLNPKEWTKWWQKHSKTPRILWMIEGLSHKDENIRYLSIEELKEITGEFFGYFYDAPKKERDKAVERWKEWWKSEGEKRFLKEG
ncbi:MAG: hypothetical protein N2746_07105 [Deltaproteobacteria bacterium]|nr:hypothetical protein [Deltaproteobacteria bacterium]